MNRSYQYSHNSSTYHYSSRTNSYPLSQPYLYGNNIINMRPTSNGVAMEATTNSSDDRITMEQDTSSSRLPRDCHNVEYQTTAGGDVVVVQPSFEDTIDNKTTQVSGPEKGTQGDQDISKEGRNPSPLKPRGHSRNLSAHFYDATSLDDRDPGQEDGAMVNEEDNSQERKHRRIFSGDLSNPNFAHRRLDSVGASTAVRREDNDRQNHHRVDSAGLDILSAAADATKEELAAAVESRGPGTSHPWDQPAQHQEVEARPSIGQVSTGSYEQPQPPPSMMQHSMHPPQPNPRVSQSSMSSYPPPHPAYMTSQPPPPPAPHSHYPPPPSHHPQQHQQYSMYYYGPPPPPPYHSRPGQGYPVQASRPPESHSMEAPTSSDGHAEWKNQQHQQRRAPPEARPNHQGSQTFVTAIAVGQGNKAMNPSTNSAPTMSTDDANAAGGPVPSHVGHHRKMSSFSSIGTLLGSSLFSPGGDDGKPGHHRHTSSTVSFLAGLEVGLDSTNDDFLRNLHASNGDFQSASSHQPPQAGAMPLAPPPAPTSSMASVGSNDSGNEKNASSAAVSAAAATATSSGTKLAVGGTSKRVRRKCTVEGCQNRVVQGGLCISHGAKRKTCKHPGCNKNVKKAGLCSTHGPARKRCSHEGCTKVAVQGGRCIAHGAKKKLCSVEACTKQAILAGMCKKHHDQKNASSAGTSKQAKKEVKLCQEVAPAAPRSSAAAAAGAAQANKKKPTHTRGLSIFQEMSADAVSNLLNDGEY